jgi:hypothetical protein
MCAKMAAEGGRTMNGVVDVAKVRRRKAEGAEGVEGAVVEVAIKAGH